MPLPEHLDRVAGADGDAGAGSNGGGTPGALTGGVHERERLGLSVGEDEPLDGVAQADERARGNVRADAAQHGEGALDRVHGRRAALEGDLLLRGLDLGGHGGDRPGRGEAPGELGEPGAGWRVSSSAGGERRDGR